ncbi:hypothetical protein TNCV_1222941 [Trichonephila clavipes]|nr:hypothetical protein TNCV_1222941 [Trichonephila clavipes]
MAQTQNARQPAGYMIAEKREQKRAGMKRKESASKLTDATAGGTKLEPALTLIPVLMRGKVLMSVANVYV